MIPIKKNSHCYELKRKKKKKHVLKTHPAPNSETMMNGKET